MVVRPSSVDMFTERYTDVKASTVANSTASGASALVTGSGKLKYIQYDCQAADSTIIITDSTDGSGTILFQRTATGTIDNDGVNPELLFSTGLHITQSANGIVIIGYVEDS